MPICTVHLFPEIAHRQFRTLTQRYPLSFTELVYSRSWQANRELRLCLTTLRRHRFVSFAACGSRPRSRCLEGSSPRTATRWQATAMLAPRRKLDIWGPVLTVITVYLPTLTPKLLLLFLWFSLLSFSLAPVRASRASLLHWSLHLGNRF